MSKRFLTPEEREEFAAALCRMSDNVDEMIKDFDKFATSVSGHLKKMSEHAATLYNVANALANAMEGTGK